MDYTIARIMPIERTAPPHVVKLVRCALAFTSLQYPALEPLDRVLVSSLIVSRVFERARLEAGSQLDLRVVVGCWNQALDLMIRADKALAVKAGLLSRLTVSIADWQHTFDRRVTSWVDGLAELPHPTNLVEVDRLDARRQALVKVGARIAHERISDSRRILSRLKQGLREVAVRRGQSTKAWNANFDPATLPVELWMLLNARPDVERLIKVESDHRLCLGTHAVRDSQSQAKDRSESDAVNLEDALEEDGVTRHDTVVVPEAPDAARFAAMLECASAVGAYRQAELQAARPGSARKAVLESLPDLQSQTLSLQDLAARVGMAPSSLADARKIVLAEIDRLPAVRALQGPI
jgi:hypothetical protein